MIDLLKTFLATAPDTMPINVFASDIVFPLTAGELKEAMAITNIHPTKVMMVDAVGGLRVRAGIGTSSSIIGKLPNGSIVSVELGGKIANGYTWVKLIEASDTALRGGFVAIEFLRATVPPVPYPLERMRKVGWHISTGTTPDLTIFKRLAESASPIPLVLLVNRPELIATIKHASPKTIVVCRNYPDDNPPLNAPQEWAYAQIQRMRPCLEAGADYLTLTNEWCAHEDQGLAQAGREADWWHKAMGVAESEGVKITVLDLAAMHLIRPNAHPNLWRDIWLPVLQKAARLGCPLNYHCYTHPTSVYDARNMSAHAMMRWLNWTAEVPNLKVIGGEFGAGNWSADVNHAPSRFMPLVRAFDQMVSESGVGSKFLGAAAFTLGATEDWRRFDFSESLSDYEKYMRE